MTEQRIIMSAHIRDMSAQVTLMVAFRTRPRLPRQAPSTPGLYLVATHPG